MEYVTLPTSVLLLCAKCEVMGGEITPTNLERAELAYISQGTGGCALCCPADQLVPSPNPSQLLCKPPTHIKVEPYPWMTA